MYPYQVSRPRIMYAFGIVALILAIPLVAMLFTNEVNWSPFDFVAAFVLLAPTALALEWVSRPGKIKKYWYLGVFALLACFLLWAEMAVGIFNSPIAGS